MRLAVTIVVNTIVVLVITIGIGAGRKCQGQQSSEGPRGRSVHMCKYLLTDNRGLVLRGDGY